jgi:hypothetical protein
LSQWQKADWHPEYWAKIFHVLCFKRVTRGNRL